MLGGGCGNVNAGAGWGANLFRNVPFPSSLEVSPFLLTVLSWGVRRSEALRPVCAAR
jgi:hypothetical protein